MREDKSPGLPGGTTAAHLARATLEGIAFQNYEILDAMRKDAGIALSSLKVDGGYGKQFTHAVSGRASQ